MSKTRSRGPQPDVEPLIDHSPTSPVSISSLGSQISNLTFGSESDECSGTSSPTKDKPDTPISPTSSISGKESSKDKKTNGGLKPKTVTVEVPGHGGPKKTKSQKKKSSHDGSAVSFLL